MHFEPRLEPAERLAVVRDHGAQLLAGRRDLLHELDATDAADARRCDHLVRLAQDVALGDDLLRRDLAVELVDAGPHVVEVGVDRRREFGGGK